MSTSHKACRCWAHSLGDCCEKLSREHLVSAALFPDATTVSVSGFPWCKGQTKEVGLASLTSKILCSTHNSRLSPLDLAAGAAFRAFHDTAALINKRLSIRASRFKIHHIRLDGIKLERWLLKTLINLCYGQEWLVGADGMNPGIPGDRLARICFGFEQFPEKSGLYLAAQVGADFSSGPVIKFSPLIFDGTYVMGGFFHFRGLLLFISLFEEPLPSSFDWVNLDGLGDWKGTAPSWHFKKMVLRANQVKSHVIHFDW